MAEPITMDKRVFGNSVGIRVLTEEHNGKIGLHRHEFYEFVYVDTGFTLHSHDGRTSVLTAGDLFAVSVNEVHSYTSAYHTKIYNVLFLLDELKGLEDEILQLPGMGDLGKPGSAPFPVLHVGLSERHDLVLLLEKMKWEYQTKGVGWELGLKSSLLSFLIFYSRLYSQGQITKESSDNNYYGYIYKALEYIEQNYAGDIGSREISECTGLSVDYIARQFKAVLQMTPSEYIRRFRVAKAMELLKNTSMSTAEIASAVGFGDLSLFSRVFKQLSGVSPTQYRRGEM